MFGITRVQVPDEAILKAIEIVTHHVGTKIEKHGRGAYLSKHEAFGIIAEEYDELQEALRDSDLQRFVEESIDVAVACIFSVASVIQASNVELPSIVPEIEPGVQVEKTENGFSIFDPYEHSLSSKHLE